MLKSRYALHIEKDGRADDLILAKFPAMRSQFDEPADRVNISVKPKSMKLKMEVAHDLNSTTPNVYTSATTRVEDNQLFVGKIVGDRIVCRPISCLLTMRFDLSHLDIKEETDPKEEVRPVSVKFSAPDRQNAPTKIEDISDYEALSYKPNGSREAAQQNIALFGATIKVKPDPDAQLEDSKPDIATLDIKPKIELIDVYSTDCSSFQNSPKKTIQIKNKVKDCLVKAKLISYQEVCDYINVQEYNRKDILDSLNELGVLVQGNWAVKSEILNGDSSERNCTDVTGVSINLYNAARDYLLWLFNQTRFVSRVEFSRKVKLPDHDILELFNQLAILRYDVKKWELKLPTDDRFNENFPDIVQRQTSLWKVRKANKLCIFT